MASEQNISSSIPCSTLIPVQSFNFGRPPCMSLAFIDCEYPTDPEGGSEASGHDRECTPNCPCRYGQSNMFLDYAWSWRYTKLVAGIMSTAFGAKTPSYSTVIDLDRKIRDFPIPSILSAKCGQVEDTDPGRFVHVQRYLVMASKEISTSTRCPRRVISAYSP